VEIVFNVIDPDDDQWTVEFSSDMPGDYLTPQILGSGYEVVYFPYEGGFHTLTINVSDGEDMTTERVMVYVEPLAGDTSDSSFLEDFACTLGCIVLFIVLSIVGFTYWTSRKVSKQTEMKPQEDVWARRMWESERTGAVPRVGDRPPSTPTPTQPPTPPPRPERPQMQAPAGYGGREEEVFEPTEKTVPYPTASVPGEDWRVQSVEEFEALLTELPEGLPEPLWGIPWWTLGKEVIASSVFRDDGVVVCQVGGKTFHADKRDTDTFMQEVED
jgi:hypothetical protein